MLVSIDLNTSYGARAVERHLGALSHAIKSKVPIAVVNNCLVTKDVENPHSREVLEGLRKFLMRCADLQVHNNWDLVPRLEIIHDFCLTIIYQNLPPAEKRFGKLPSELQGVIRTFLPPREIFRTSLICKLWYKDTTNVLHAFINAGHGLRLLFPKARASEIVEWSRQGSLAGKLEYASFFLTSGDIEDNSLQRFASFHTSLLKLDISQSRVTGDGLANLSFLPHLTALDFGYIHTKAPFSLDVLKCVPLLKSLKTTAVNLQPNALDNLSFTPRLERLLINRCHNLAADALKSLKFTPHLKSLSIRENCQFEGNVLRFLEYVPNLEILNLGYCSVSGDTLKNLKFVPRLQVLYLNTCIKLESWALRHLENTTDLRLLDISSCKQFHPRILSYLRHVTRLESLELYESDQLERDCLKELCHTPRLYRLDMRSITHLDPNSSKKASNFRFLRSISPSWPCSYNESNFKPYNLRRSIGG